jgi:hypothetical protein
MKLHGTILDALMKYQIDADEFFSRTIIAAAVEARREVIEKLAAAGLNNRAVARIVKRNVCTVRYWRNPNIREYRRVYKAGARLQPEIRA